MKYHEPKPGEWQRPRLRGYRMQCCDCGLVHVFNFKVVLSRNGRTQKVLFQAFRNERATAAVRRNFETIRVIKGPKAKAR